MFLRILSLFAVAGLGGAVFAADKPTPAEQQLQQKLNQAEKQINTLQAELKKAKANDNAEDKTIVQLKQQVDQLQAELKKAKAIDNTEDKVLRGALAQLESLRKVKYVHTIVYKSKADTKAVEMQALADDANLFFATVKSVRGVWAGKASETVGASAEYQAVIVLLFDDANGFQSFQKDPQWKRFTDKHAKKWEDPKYYDAVIGK